MIGERQLEQRVQIQKVFRLRLTGQLQRNGRHFEPQRWGGIPVVLEANIDDLPLRRGRPGKWADPDELFIDLIDFDLVGGGICN
ncbi:hypothetical protein [Gimesia aquarii]|nr:hypothetical protein [Gimesia aquarii]